MFLIASLPLRFKLKFEECICCESCIYQIGSNVSVENRSPKYYHLQRIATSSKACINHKLYKKKVIDEVETFRRPSNVTTGVNKNVTQIATDPKKSKYDIVLKLHRQFAHPSADKLIKLINSPGGHWEKDQKDTTSVSDDCEICQIYKKSPARPIARLPMATSFKECIAMDLKFYKGKIILHLVDQAKKLPTSCFATSNETKAIINGITRIWIQIYRKPENFTRQRKFQI